jgi:hypothetical protein
MENCEVERAFVCFSQALTYYSQLIRIMIPTKPSDDAIVAQTRVRPYSFRS